MPRWSLSPTTGATVGELRESLNQRLVDLDLILGELEQLEQQLKGSNGYTAQMSGTLDMQGNRLKGLPLRPKDDSEACSWQFHRNGDFLYSESDTFSTKKRIAHNPARTGGESVTLKQLRDALDNLLINLIQSTTFTITGTGFVANPTGTARLLRLDRLALLFLPSLTGTSNAGTFTLTGLPVASQPTQTTNHLVLITDGQGGATDAYGILQMTAGSPTLTLISPVTATGAWTASGTKTLHPCWLIYALL